MPTLNISKGKSRLAPGDVEATHRLANVRTHVERVIGAVRQRFKTLNATTLPTEYTKSKLGGPVFLDSIVCKFAVFYTNVCDIIVQPSELFDSCTMSLYS